MKKAAALILLSILSITAFALFRTYTKSNPSLINQIQKALPVSKTTVIAAGDMVCNFQRQNDLECFDKEVSDLAIKNNPDLFLTLGDEQYENGSAEDFANYYSKSWGRLKEITKPSLGNHEYGTLGAEGHFDYFNGLSKNSGVAGQRGKGYYSFDESNWHFISLNSNCSAIKGCTRGSPQAQWLISDLEKNDKRCILAYWHHPLFSSGYHGNNNLLMKDIWEILYDNKASVVLNGHDHHYERFGKLDPEGKKDPKNGIAQFIVGTGGRSLYPIVEVAPNSQFRISGSFGFLKLTLSPTSYQWEFIAIDNTALDKGEENCN